MATATDFIEFVIILIGSYFVLVGKFLKILFNPFSKDRNNRRNIVMEPRVTRGCKAIIFFHYKATNFAIN